MTKPITFFFALLTFTVTLATHIDGEEYKPDFRKAQQLLEKGLEEHSHNNYRFAVKLLREALHEDPGSIEINFALGRAAYQATEFEEALFAYDRVLVIDPLHTVAMLEKARTQLALGGKAEARATLEDVQELDLPEDIKPQVHHLLACIDPPPCYWGGLFSVGHTYDSNVTLGNRTSVPISPSLNSSPSQRSDNAYNSTFVLNYNRPVFWEELVWGNSFIAYVSDNARVDSNDLNLIGLTSSIRWHHCGHQAGASFSWTQMKLAGDGFQNNSRVAFTHAYSLTECFEFHTDYYFTKRHHFGTEPATYGLVSSYGGGLSYTPNECNRLRLDGFRRYDKTPVAGTPPMNYYRNEGTVAYERSLFWKLKTVLKATYRTDRYQNFHALYPTTKRNDWALVGAVTLIYPISSRIAFTVTGENIHNESNILLNNYDSRRVASLLSAVF